MLTVNQLLSALLLMFQIAVVLIAALMVFRKRYHKVWVIITAAFASVIPWTLFLFENSLFGHIDSAKFNNLFAYAAFAIMGGSIIVLSRLVIRQERVINFYDEKQKRQNQIFNMLPVLIYSMDSKGELLRIHSNSYLERLLGYSYYQLMGFRNLWRSTIHPQHWERMDKFINEINESGSSTCVYMRKKSDGTYRWFMDKATRLSKDSDKESEIIGISIDIQEHINVQAETIALRDSIEEANEKIQKLSGLLPICCSCKKIRDDEGYWEQIEQFIEDHSDVEFTHALCPECAKTMYKEYFHEKEPVRKKERQNSN